MRRDEILLEIDEERDRQDKKWGEQNHPDLCPYTVGENGEHTCSIIGIPTAALQKAWVDKQAKAGKLGFADIVLEEYCESIEAPEGPERRKELIQTAACIVAWIEAMDRRAAKAAVRHQDPAVLE